MAIDERFLTINVNDSESDSRSLIMPHQSEAVKAMTEYFKLKENTSDRSGIVVMPHVKNGRLYENENYRDALAELAVQVCKDNNATLLGAVLTKVDIKKQKAKYGYKYDYYYSNSK